MAEIPVSRKVVINNAEGLHARPATQLANKAGQFSATVELVVADRRVDAKSVMHVLTLGAAQGTELLLEARGVDAQLAVDTIVQLIEDGFPETKILGQKQV